MTRLARRLPVGVAAVVLALAIAVGAGAGRSRGEPTFAEQVEAVATGVRCPTCRGQSVAESDAASSVAIRRVIESRLREGATPKQVRYELAARYGDDILLRPPASGFGALVWVLPVVAVFGAGGGLAVAFRRWGAAAGAVPSPSDDDRRLVEDVLRSGRP